MNEQERERHIKNTKFVIGCFFHVQILTSLVKVAQWGFSVSRPPKFEHKVRRH